MHGMGSGHRTWMRGAKFDMVKDLVRRLYPPEAPGASIAGGMGGGYGAHPPIGNKRQGGAPVGAGRPPRKPGSGGTGPDVLGET